MASGLIRPSCCLHELRYITVPIVGPASTGFAAVPPAAWRRTVRGRSGGVLCLRYTNRRNDRNPLFRLIFRGGTIGLVTVPSDPASEARAIASALVAASPNLITVLDWHTGLCPSCERGQPKCAEYAEILDEYGAGARGATVFFPAETSAAAGYGG
jgi:hypothetical protein